VHLELVPAPPTHLHIGLELPVLDVGVVNNDGVHMGSQGGEEGLAVALMVLLGVGGGV
jgi:hypothetical protein